MGTTRGGGSARRARSTCGEAQGVPRLQLLGAACLLLQAACPPARLPVQRPLPCCPLRGAKLLRPLCCHGAASAHACRPSCCYYCSSWPQDGGPSEEGEAQDLRRLAAAQPGGTSDTSAALPCSTRRSRTATHVAPQQRCDACKCACGVALQQLRAVWCLQRFAGGEQVAGNRTWPRGAGSRPCPGTARHWTSRNGDGLQLGRR